MFILLGIYMECSISANRSKHTFMKRICYICYALVKFKETSKKAAFFGNQARHIVFIIINKRKDSLKNSTITIM